MAGEQLLIDPTAEATGTQLDITDNALGYWLLDHIYPDPDPVVVQAESIDTEGAVPAAGKHNPRTITVKIRCAQPSGGTPSIGTMVSNLQRKVGKLWREGGTFRRVLPSGDSVTFDCLQFGARIVVPADKRWVNRGLCTVTLTFTCTPYGRGAATSATLSASTATNTKAPFVFTTPGAKGDVPGLGSLALSNATTSKTFAAYGVRSRYYDASSDGRLFYEAEDGSAVTAAAAVGPAGASGSGGNKVMTHSALTTSGDLSYQVKPSGATLAHVGLYVVYARVQAGSGNSGTAGVWLQWQAAVGRATVDNDLVSIESDAGTAIKGSWVVLNLGVVSIPKARYGSQAWRADVLALSTVAGDAVHFDWLLLMPASEGSGVVKEPVSAINSAGLVQVDHDAVWLRNSATNYYAPKSFEGDYLLIPPSGAEGRTVEIAAFMTGQTGGSANMTETLIDAANFDAISAALTVTPRYLSVPAP